MVPRRVIAGRLDGCPVNDPGRSLLVGAEALRRAHALNASAWGPAAATLAGASTIWATGLGKSALVARKFAATLASFGRRACFVHPVEALHGDGGAIAPGDAILAASHSGRTAEVLRFLAGFTQPGGGEGAVPVVAVCTPGTPLSALSVATLDCSVTEEAGGEAPVTSFAVACALVDGLALALRAGNALHHPGGLIALARQPVRALMLPPPIVPASTPVADCIPRLGQGAVLVEGGGIFTDGDLRRVVGVEINALSRPVAEFCTRSPVTVHQDEPASVALDRMERRASQLSVLPVVDDQGAYVGLVRLHDLVRAGMGA